MVAILESGSLAALLYSATGSTFVLYYITYVIRLLLRIFVWLLSMRFCVFTNPKFLVLFFFCIAS